MEEKDLIVKFWKKEGRTTRNVLARIPEGSTYTPDPKSRPAAEIAWQIVHEEKTLIDGLERGVMEWVNVPAPATMRETVDAYDKHLATFVDRLTALDKAHWEAQIPFMFGTHEVNRSTGYAQAWGFLFDIIHHRGQIYTMLGMLNVETPPLYGMTATDVQQRARK